ncbi:hypothetical protein TIFTF001_006269 [Ficus carica]|uniref:Pectinesterase n=1 Tax=Ficus carica TaxID=3494 RepID=A0AA87ZQP6_FICCA|nr:hypothetical protein TIFTF001_006269 [Ficus carica]
MSGDKEPFAGVSNSGGITALSRKQKKLFVALFATLVVVAAVIGIAAGVSSRQQKSVSAANIDASTHAVLKSACSITRYPELCYSAVAASSAATGGSSKKVRSQKDVIELSVNLTITAVQENYVSIKKLTKRKGLTKREKTALKDCLETIDETLDELHEVQDDLDHYPNKKSLKQHADDLLTLLSSAITNQETCLDGFSHDKADEHVREALIKGEVHVEKMCSNVLALIKNMTDTDIAAERETAGRKLREEEEVEVAGAEVDEQGWPTWMSAADRRLLQSSSVTPNVVVAKDGSGDYTTVSAAVAAAPDNSKTRYVIRIKAGVYKENVDVSKKKKNIMFLGDGRTTTIITASRNVVDGSTTFNSATVDL